MGYQRVDGAAPLTAGVYTESVSNAAFTALRPARIFVPVYRFLPDLGTNSQIFNVGNYNRIGYTAAAKQSLRDHLDASVAVGRAGALAAVPRRSARSRRSRGIRSAIRVQESPWMTAAFPATVPFSGTRIQSTYGWTDPRAMMPDHLYLTGDVNQSTGWNVRVRQPLPFFPGLAGRLEATAELRNMLAQGYLPLDVNRPQGAADQLPARGPRRAGVHFLEPGTRVRARK